MSTSTIDNTASLRNVLGKHERSRSNLIPILQDVQGNFGFLPSQAIMEIARYLKISEAEIYGVATFYAQFRFTPIGKNVFTVCRGTACHVRGSFQILEELERELGIKAGCTTTDLNFTIQTVACVGSCALAPLTVLNGKVYGRMTKTKLRTLIKDIKKTEEAAPIPGRMTLAEADELVKKVKKSKSKNAEETR